MDVRLFYMMDKQRYATNKERFELYMYKKGYKAKI